MNLPLDRPVTNARNRAAFTLIELLAVMTIILVLAGLILNIAGSAQYNSAKSRAKSEIAAIGTALESYKTDNGIYPPDPYTPTTTATQPTTLLDPQNVTSTANTDPTNQKYINNSEYLYQVLSGYPVTINPQNGASTTMSKTYMKFTPQQLKADSSNTGTTPNPWGYYIIDPFGFSYGYSTAYAANAAYQAAQPSPQPVTQGYNPTFDLWSTGGYAAGGKTTPSTRPNGMTPAAFYSSLWITNW